MSPASEDAAFRLRLSLATEPLPPEDGELDADAEPVGVALGVALPLAEPLPVLTLDADRGFQLAP